MKYTTLTKNEKKRIITKNIGLYLLSIVFSIFLSVILINYRTSPKENERISIFIASSIVDDERLIDEYFSNVLGVKKISVYYIDPSSDEFDDYYSLHGAMESCIIILPSSQIIEDEIIGSMKTLSLTTLLDKYMIDSNCFGYKIYDGASKAGLLKAFISYSNEDYYIFVSRSAYHSKDNDSVAEQILENIINEAQ